MGKDPEITDRLQRRLKFERLLSNLSSKFINLTADLVDKEVDQALLQIQHHIKIDRISLGQYSDDGSKFYVTHSCAKPGIPRMPAVLLNKQLPWFTKRVKRGETVVMERHGDLPESAAVDKRYFQRVGIKSNILLPLMVSGSFVGALGIASFRTERQWTEDLVSRLQLVGEIFANALMRKKKEQELSAAFEKISDLKEKLEAENVCLQQEIQTHYKHKDIIGNSPAIKKVLNHLELVAPTDTTVLLTGETGTGKELIARAIHNLSPRQGCVMIKLNCAALPAALVESELFGSEKGAYTGSTATHIGRFEIADKSTLFLDEIGEMPLELQAKLLRVLQEGQFERLGSSKPIKVNVRIIAATNRDLAKQVKQGKFREDLFYRLNVFPIWMPPLRDHPEDVHDLVWTFVKEFSESMGKQFEQIGKKDIDLLEQYTYPGNVRELRNIIERSMIISNGPILHIDLPRSDASSHKHKLNLRDVEREHILSVLRMTGWRVSGNNGAAELLGLKRTTLESMMKRLGIKRNTNDDISG